MARKPAFAPKEPIEKLPLAVRKDLRDNYEAKKAELEGKIAELLGIDSFKANLNANEIWAYNTDARQSIGGMFYRYVDGFLSCLKRYIDNFDDDGRVHFNEAVSQSELQIHVNPLGDKAPTIDCDIKDGIFNILFHHENLGYNQDYIYSELLKAVERAPREGLSIRAKKSVQEEYEENIDDLRDKIAETLAMPNLVIEPSFEENFKALKTAKGDNSSWEESFGRATLGYINGLKSQLERQGFKGDEMLQEGLAEVMTAQKIVFLVVPEIKKRYHEVILEDGVLYLRTIPNEWWVNVDEAGSGLVDML
ncbi:hypothetical protein Moror_15647 [Moniliophthora roreri MCA 2997]|uniref:Uncharacterized protein n=2 Tax=Moniliophthora roreri TaxID=221103 RepID=V2WT43_MONRO|nr:hypothetical protein Moror_15647 [Moniliophthora roreri MCA 2997]